MYYFWKEVEVAQENKSIYLVCKDNKSNAYEGKAAGHLAFDIMERDVQTCVSL